MQSYSAATPMILPQLFSAVPGEVINLICPDSSDAGVLNIRWQHPNISSHCIIDYLVEAQEYFQLPNYLESRPLSPPFQQEVLSAQVNTTVTSGVGMCMQDWLFIYLPCSLPPSFSSLSPSLHAPSSPHLPSLNTHTHSCSEPFTPYRVSVMPHNAVGCGFIVIISIASLRQEEISLIQCL